MPTHCTSTTLTQAEEEAVSGGAAPRIELTETEATLFALGIRADTGVLSFPATTARDAQALAWLMERGCSQSAIAEFGQSRLSSMQRELLSEAKQRMG